MRLVEGQSIAEGRLEICLEGQWGTVCDDLFAAADAGVACSQLGFASIGEESFIASIILFTCSMDL